MHYENSIWWLRIGGYEVLEGPAEPHGCIGTRCTPLATSLNARKMAASSQKVVLEPPLVHIKKGAIRCAMRKLGKVIDFGDPNFIE